MRIVVAIILATMFVSPGKSATLDIGSGAEFTISRPSDLQDFSSVFIGVGFTFTGGDYIGTVPPDPFTGPFYGYDLRILASSGFGEIELCSFSQISSMCGRNSHNAPFVALFVPGSTTATLTIGGGAQTFGDVSPISVDITLSVPDPFTLSFGPVAAVPEPSTWAMLLIGFAGIGFVASRSSQRLEPNWIKKDRRGGADQLS